MPSRLAQVELRHLSYFVAVAEELHFGRAARRLHVSTPTLSQQIQALEREVGTLLIERDSRRVSLTAAGKALLDEARATLRGAEAAVREARRAAGVENPVMRLGLLHGIPDWLADRLERTTLDALPGWQAALTGGTSADQVELLRHDEVDLALVRLPLEAPDSLGVLPVAQEELGVLMSGQHPLAETDSLGPADLAGQELVWIHRRLAPGFYDAITQRIREFLPDLRISKTSVSQAQVPGLLARDARVISLSSPRAASPPGLVWRRLAMDEPLNVTFAAIWHSPIRDRAVRMLVAALRHEVRSGVLTEEAAC